MVVILGQRPACPVRPLGPPFLEARLWGGSVVELSLESAASMAMGPFSLVGDIIQFALLFRITDESGLRQY